MLKSLLVAVLSLASLNAVASPVLEKAPFTIAVGEEVSDTDPAKMNTLVQFTNEGSPIVVYEIVVDKHQCVPLKQIPDNFEVPRHLSFILTFAPKSGKSCNYDSILVKTNKGDFDMATH